MIAIGLMSGCLKASKRLVGKLIPDWKSVAGRLLRRKIVTWYLISRTVSEDDAHRGNNDDRSVGAFAVKPAPSARRYTALGLERSA